LTTFLADMYVPPSQIVDTVNIYHLPHRHRKISLRFLSWVVLDQDIQSSGSHDSIEDARTALQLYEKYCQLDAEQRWESTLEEVYREGGRLGWKVPGSTETMQVSPAMAHRQDTVAHAARSPSEGLPMTMNRLGLP
jgi:PAB-dependent poly(A)-specific ribonuclease subunit 2